MHSKRIRHAATRDFQDPVDGSPVVDQHLWQHDQRGWTYILPWCRATRHALYAAGNDIGYFWCRIPGSTVDARRNRMVFDEQFFAYLEETDLSLRAMLAGYTSLYVPTSKVYHRYTFRFSERKSFDLEKNRLYMFAKIFRCAAPCSPLAHSAVHRTADLVLHDDERATLSAAKMAELWLAMA